MSDFPYAGPEGNRIYMVGMCRVCGLALGSDKPVKRDYCFEHEEKTPCQNILPLVT